MKKTIKNLKIIYKYGKEYRKSLLYELIASIIGIIIGVLLPILAARQIVYLTDNNWLQLISMSVVILVVGFISALKTVLIRKNTQKFTVGVTEKMQKQLGTEILMITQTDLTSKSTGTFVQRMTSDTDELANMFTIGFGRCVHIVSSIGVFIAIFFINKVVFAYYFLVTFVLTFLHLIKSKKYNKYDKMKRIEQERVTSLTSELVRGISDVKMLNAKNSFIKDKYIGNPSNEISPIKFTNPIYTRPFNSIDNLNKNRFTYNYHNRNQYSNNSMPVNVIRNDNYINRKTNVNKSQDFSPYFYNNKTSNFPSNFFK